MSMSRCSSTVLTVCGRVGLVDDGSTCGCAGHRDDVRRVPAARALGVVRVDAPPGDRGERVLHVAGLVQRVGVDRHLHAGLVGHPQAGVDRGGRRAPVLVQLEPADPGLDLLVQRVDADGVALAEQRDVERRRVERLQHPRDVPGDPGVTVVAFVPSAGPVPPPIHVVIAGRRAPPGSASARSGGRGSRPRPR